VANEAHLKRLKRGIEEWHEWRSKNPSIIPDLSRADLRGANLRKSDLRDANLNGANLRKSDLRDANLNGADLRDANLNGADLRDADFSGASLDGANLDGAILSRTNLRDTFLRDTFLSGAILNGADFSGADLSGAILSRTDLSGAILSRADLSRADLRYTDLSDFNLSDFDLSGAILSGAILSGAILRNTNFNGADLNDADLNDADLRDTNLSSAILSGAILSGAILSGADLSGAILSHIAAIATSFLNSDLTSATLTGACIQDWNINSGTRLDDVKCEYVYLKGGWSEQEKQYILSDRRPSDPNTIFAPGEFAQLFQKALETVDLIFADGIDWQAFFQSFQELRSQYDDENLSIQAIEKKSGGAFVIRLEVPPEADKGAIESQAKELYTEKLKLLESSYQAQLQMQGEQLEHERQRNSQLMRVVEVMAENTGPKYDLRHANIGNMADTVKDNARQQTNQYNYESPEKQSLAEAAIEIQRLLKVLEASNPTATEADQKAFVSAGVSPTMKQRAVGALQSGGKAALEEFLDNPYVNVGVAIVEGWREAK
jgi:uncharacterized protein YjbI with pentapeptide repeats